MKMTSHTHHRPFVHSHLSSWHMNSVARECAAAWELVDEICEAVGSVVAMPLCHPHYDPSLEQLDEHLLEDIGYETSETHHS